MERNRFERVVAKPFSMGGVERRPGETVVLRREQIIRLEARGCLEPERQSAPEGANINGTEREA